jgi:hypothetical protein
VTWKPPALTLGWAILDWLVDNLPSPSRPEEPFVPTDEQSRFILDWYSIYPHTGRYVYRRAVIEQAKGWGKSPLAGALVLAEFAGPVVFSHFDAKGQPVGHRWGEKGTPAPWVQVAAVSEDQTENTYGALYEMLSVNDHRAAKALGIDDGRTRLYLRDRPGKLEPVTASAGSREGQRVTAGLLDETHLWTPRNGGVKLARTIRRNAAKMSGRTIETTNAPILGDKSVAEDSGDSAAAGEPGILHWSNRPKVEPQPDWSDEQLVAALEEVYGDARWIDRQRILAEIRDPGTPWTDALRFYFNVRTTGAGKAVAPPVWDALAKPREVPAGAYIGVGFDGSYSRDATFLRGCTQDGYRWTIGKWERPTGDDFIRWQLAHPGEEWTVDRQAVRDTLALTFERYRVGRMYADPWKWQTEIADWERDFGDKVVIKLDTNQSARFAPIVDQWLTAIREGREHDGDPVAREHVLNANLAKVRLADDPDDTRTRYVLVKGEDKGKIDGAVADALALGAAMSMPDEPPRTGYFSAIEDDPRRPDIDDEDDDE